MISACSYERENNRDKKKRDRIREQPITRLMRKQERQITLLRKKEKNKKQSSDEGWCIVKLTMTREVQQYKDKERETIKHKRRNHLLHKSSQNRKGGIKEKLSGRGEKIKLTTVTGWRKDGKHKKR